MSLTDPKTPEGFFHMRVVPYADLCRRKGVTFFSEKPEPEAHSYFESARAAVDQPRIIQDADLLSGAGCVARLLQHWSSENRTLAEFGADLEAMRLFIAEGEQTPDEIELTDFVYPLF